MADEQKLISAANSEFESGKFSQCISTLVTLGAARPNDWKVSLNKAIVEFHETGKKQFAAFQKQLNTIAEQLNVNMSTAPEDVDHSSLFFNQAVLFHLQGQNKEALDAINKIFPLISDMDDGLAQRVSLLVLDLNSLFGFADKALANIAHIEEQLTSSSLTMPKKSNEEKSPPGSEFKIVLLNHKARCHLALKNYDACKADLDAISAAGASSFSSAMTKAELYMATKEYDKALESLYSFQQETDIYSLPRDQAIKFYNNTAVVNHHLAKTHSASFYMKKALIEYKEWCDEDKDSIRTSLRPKLMSNLGVALLFKGDPGTAFDCALEASQELGMAQSPLLWLRLAECCLFMYKSSNEDTFNLSQKRKHLVEGLCGTETINNIVLNNKIYQDSGFNPEPQSYAVPMPTLEFGSLCSRNALFLLPSGSSKLKLGVLSVNAYIRLTIGDPVLALKHSTALVNDPGVTPLYKYLGRLYSAEAYLLLDQIDKAVQILDPTTYKDCDPTEEAIELGWIPRSTSTSQSISLYNLAVCLTIRNDLDKASEILKHVWVSRGSEGQVPVHVLALALYIELIQGRVDVAKKIIKQNCPHVFQTV